MISEDGLISLIKAAPEPKTSKAEPMEVDDDDDDVMVIADESAPTKTKALKAEFNKLPSSSRPGSSAPRVSGSISRMFLRKLSIIDTLNKLPSRNMFSAMRFSYYSSLWYSKLGYSDARII